MSEAGYSKCPYCMKKLEKKPSRKSKCPHCAQIIYVRAGDLMRDDEIEALEKAGARSTAKSTGKSTAKPATGKAAGKTKSAGTAKSAGKTSAKAGSAKAEKAADTPAAKSSKPAKKTTSAKKATSGSKSSAAKKETAQKKSKSTLEADLKKKKSERYKKDELDGGIKIFLDLIGEMFGNKGLTDMLAGMLGGGLGASLLGGLFGGGSSSSGLVASESVTEGDGESANAFLRKTLASLDLGQLLQAAGALYESLDAEQQKQLRAVVTWIQGGFSLGDQLDDSAA